LNLEWTMEHLLNNLNHIARPDTEDFSCSYSNYLMMFYLIRLINYA